MINKKQTRDLLFKQLVFILFISCAAVMSPPGGPKDEIPPELIEIIPPNGATYFKGGLVELLFSEYIDENTIDRAITILPLLVEEPEIIYKGKRLHIYFPDSLLMDQTYIISINRDLTDEHKVNLSQGIQVAFSTGSEIDNGIISGTVQYSKDASLNLWKIQNDNDNLKFYERVPDYVIDASSEGYYEFNFLSSGEYRIAAVDRSVAGVPIILDRFTYGLSWLPTIELIGQETIKGINMKIPDKLGGIKMINAETFQDSWGRITFTQSINDVINDIQLEVKSDDSSVLNADLFQDPEDDTKLYFLLENATNDYISIHLNEVKRWNNTLVEPSSIRLNMQANIDTTELSIVQPNTKYRLQLKSNLIEPLKIIFSNLIEPSSNINSILLLRDSVLIPYDLIWDTPMSLNLFPKTNWESSSNYELKLFKEEILPIYGASLKDSVTSISFKTSDYQNFGSLIIKTKKSESSNIIAELQKMEKPYSILRSVVNFDGKIIMREVPEGNYSLMFFQDQDSSMQYSYGQIDPYRTAEWFYYYQDTIKIRSNWDMELQQIGFDLAE